MQAIESAIEHKFSFHAHVVLRSTADLRDVVARNPFAGRNAIDHCKLLVTFLLAEPDAETKSRLRRVSPHPEEVRLLGRELFIYFADGIGPSKLTPVLGRILNKSGTSRNFNTVTKLLEIAERFEIGRR